MIDILIPMYGRGDKAQAIVDNIHQATEVKHKILFICTYNDVERQCDLTGEAVVVVPWPCGDADYAKKINLGFLLTDNPWVFTGASDLEFTRGWDTEALRVWDRGMPGVVGTNDHANPLVKRGKHSTHSLLNRHFINTVGGTFHDGPYIVYSEAYRHQWVDTELCRAAMDRGEWAFARRSVVRHLHPFFHKQTPMDDTYTKALGDSAMDSATYRERVGRWTSNRRATVL